MNKILNILKKVNYSRILLFINVIIMTSVFLLNSTAIHTLGEIRQLIELDRLAWKQEITTLTETLIISFNSFIENEKKQIEIDNQQQIEIKNLNKVLFKFGQLIIENHNKQVKLTAGIIEVINDLQNTVSQTIERLKKMKTIDLKNIENIKEANIIMLNSSTGMQGSGSHIKIEGESYILTVAHLIGDEKDFIWGILEDNNWHSLELIKYNKKRDLALFKIFMVKNLSYLEISDEFPKEGSEITLIGNPADLEDIITNGIIAKITKKEYIFTNLNWYGNSGGAILYKGKIVGIISSSLSYIRPPLVISYGVGIKLEQIKEFLK